MLNRPYEALKILAGPHRAHTLILSTSSKLSSSRWRP
jgi:hypothetical protein